MKNVVIKDIKELVIDKDQVLIYQKGGGVIKLSKEFVKKVGKV